MTPFQSPAHRFKAEQPKTTVVLNIDSNDVDMIRLGIKSRIYDLPAVQRVLVQLLGQLPKEN